MRRTGTDRGPDCERLTRSVADGVSPSTASLPAEWDKRLIPICNPNTNGATGWCIETHDIAVA